MVRTERVPPPTHFFLALWQVQHCCSTVLMLCGLDFFDALCGIDVAMCWVDLIVLCVV